MKMILCGKRERVKLRIYRRESVTGVHAQGNEGQKYEGKLVPNNLFFALSHLC